jgi:hypothetical protein
MQVFVAVFANNYGVLSTICMPVWIMVANPLPAFDRLSAIRAFTALFS